MNRSVEPIRNKSAIENIKTTLRNQPHPRDYLLFVLGINSAFRASDLLRLKVNDIIENGRVKSHIKIRQQKTGKEVMPKANKAIREAINHYLKNNGHLEPEDLLFTSYRSKTRLDNTSFWNLVKRWTGHLDGGPYGTHSLRKTWGYQAWKAGIDREIIMLKLGKNSYIDTRRYLGISQDEVGEAEDLISL